MNFGDYLSTPFNHQDIYYRLQKLFNQNYIYPIHKLRHYFTQREWVLCRHLSNQADSIISYSELLALLNITKMDRLRQCIYKIKKIIQQSEAKEFIEIKSIRNSGYQWINCFVNNLWITI